ncbi:phosphonate metabolism transcriptional regulator PhnF [Rhizobium sp.]
MRRTGVAVYKIVADELAEQINSGELEPGVQLPTETELSTRFNINRHTLRRAISILSDIGLVNVEHGRGTFVTNGAMNYPVQKEMSFTDIIAKSSRLPEAQFLRASRVKAKGMLAEDLQVELGTECMMIDMLRFASKVPISVSSHFYVAERFPDLAEMVEGSHSLSKSFKACGVKGYVRKLTRISCRSSTEEETRLLKQPPTRPVLVAEILNVDGNGTPVEHAIIRSASERLKFSFET